MGNFTDTYVRSLKGKDKRYEEYEGAGFGIRVTPSSLKTWIYRYKLNKKTDKITLGHYPKMSLSVARKKFLELYEIRRMGVSPKQFLVQQNEKKNDNVKGLVLDWYNAYVLNNRKKPHNIKQHIEADIIPLLGHFALDKVKAIDISKALDVIVNRGAPIHANRVLSSIKQAFNYGVSRGHLEVNPSASIRARDIGGLERSRERVLSHVEITTIWQFLDTNNCHMSIQTRSAIKIILLTGVRTAEIRLAKWDNLNFENSLWIIPSENTKGGVAIKVHLTELTKSIFSHLKAISDSSFVLPGKDSDKCLDENALPRAIRRIQDRVGIPHWTAHDLRRTFATQLGETLNIDPVVIEKCLGHKMPKIMATYNRNEMLPQRKDALEKWSSTIYQLVDSNSTRPNCFDSSRSNIT